MWRDLARKQVPWRQWSRDDQLSALDDDLAARKRLFATDDVKLSFFDDDRELERLLQPYRNDLKDLFNRRSTTSLTINPSIPVIGKSFTFQIDRGKNVTFEAEVTLPNSTFVKGLVSFTIVNFGLQQLGTISLVAGKALLSTSKLLKGNQTVKANYPDTANIIGSSAEIRLQVN